jgi:hypothetical protein
MTIFAILMPRPQENLSNKIREVFPNDHYVVTVTQWLISAPVTAYDITIKLGIVDPTNTHPPTGNAIILGVWSYHGRAPTPMWDWVKVKLEPPQEINTKISFVKGALSLAGIILFFLLGIAVSYIIDTIAGDHSTTSGSAPSLSSKRP